MVCRQLVKGFRALLIGWAMLAPGSGALAAEFTLVPLLGGSYQTAHGLSLDGTTVVGEANTAANSVRAFLFRDGNILDLGTLAGGTSSRALGVSADGGVVVGYATNADDMNRAFRWTNGRMQDLGTLGGDIDASYAYAVSADGRVVVGESESVAGRRAFRWADGQMVSLGVLVFDGSSVATGVSADGSVVIGSADNANGNDRAFRWTADDGMIDLGTLGGGNSYATALSADGRVVVGQADTGRFSLAFRWEGGVMDALVLSGGHRSEARGVSADGAAVAGWSQTRSGQYHAFRWTDDDGTVDLGTLGGNESYAHAISADGSTVVGWSDTDVLFARSAFRWHESTGMQSVADWLADSGVTVDGLMLREATGVSADGSVLMGFGLDDERAERIWLARAGALIDPAQWLGSVSSNRQVFHTGMQLSNMALHGAHHRPLMSYTHPGAGPGFWVTGDLGSYGDGRNTMAGAVEAGLYNDYAAGRLRAGIGLGYSGQRQDLPYSGSADLDGGHVVAEINWRALADTDLILSATAIYGLWDAQVKRGYLNGSAVEHSRGDTDVQNASLRLKVDWQDAASLGTLRLAPYAGMTLSHTRMGGYREKSGDVPAQFDTQEHDALEMRIGMAGTQPLTDTLRLRLTLEGVHRFDSRGPSLSGRETGGFGIDFDLKGDRIDRNWVRGGGELEWNLGDASLLALSLNGASSGQDPDISGALTYRRKL